MRHGRRTGVPAPNGFAPRALPPPADAPPAEIAKGFVVRFGMLSGRGSSLLAANGSTGAGGGVGGIGVAVGAVSHGFCPAGDCTASGVQGTDFAGLFCHGRSLGAEEFGALLPPTAQGGVELALAGAANGLAGVVGAAAPGAPGPPGAVANGLANTALVDGVAEDDVGGTPGSVELAALEASTTCRVTLPAASATSAWISTAVADFQVIVSA